MYYNQTLLDQEGMTVPETLDELVAFCGEATEKGYIPIAFADSRRVAGVPPVLDDGQPDGRPGGDAGAARTTREAGTRPEIVTAIEAFFVTLRDAGCFPEDAVAITYDDGNSLFFNGEALLHTTGSWLVAEIEENMPDTEVGFVPFPEIEGGAGPRLDLRRRVGLVHLLRRRSIRTRRRPSSTTSSRRKPSTSGSVCRATSSRSRSILPISRSIPLDRPRSSRRCRPPVRRACSSATTSTCLAPPEFNDMMSNGFQAMLVGDKTAEQQAADLEAAWEEGMPESEATPAP